MYRASFMVLMRSWSSLPSMVKIVSGDSMSRDVKMVMYGGWDLKMFLKPLFKISCRLSNILFITIHPVTFIPIYDFTFLEEWIFVLGSHEKVFDSMTSCEMYFNPILLANSLVAFTQPLMVRYHNVRLWSSDFTWLLIVFVALLSP